MMAASFNPAIQAGAAGNTPASTQQNPGAAGARTFGDAVDQAVKAGLDAEVAAARARAKVAAAQGGAVTAPTPPTAPTEPGTIVVRGPNGAQTITIPPFAFRDQGIPQQVVDISVAFFLTMAAIIIGLPLARAFARRMDRRGGSTQVPAEISNQLTQLNQAVDAIALEVERISEGQRYTTRLLSEQREPKLPTSAER